ncbi:MAG TPA: S8 family serine peptidase [Phycisphaerales bacterium]|nr:S8 family serine peptidase [Phycisphaerales bacterium]
MKITNVLVLAAGLTVSGAAAVAPAQETKKPVATAADLPVHTYTIEGKASEFMQSKEPFAKFAAQLRADIEKTLAEYDIKDRTTLKDKTLTLAQIAAFEGRWNDVPALVEQVRGLEEKESKRLMTGATLLAYAEAKKTGATGEAFTGAFKKSLAARVGAMPWNVVAEEVKSARGRAQMITRDFVIGQVTSQLDPMVEASQGKLSSDFAANLVNLRLALDHMIAVQPAVAEVYGAMIEKNSVAMADDWTPTLVDLTGMKGTPVVIGVWDSGVDAKALGDAMWVNTREQVNGKDDDGNGFVDDVNGIAFDLHEQRTPDLLHPLDELKGERDIVVAHTKGMMDLRAAVESPEADALRKHMATLKPEAVGAFIEDLGLFGNHAHGTHVAGIAADRNPFARILGARLTFDFRQIPLVTPSEEVARRMAENYKATTEYFGRAGVRVVNMSWGGSIKDVEAQIEMKLPNLSAEERREMARKLFDIGAQGLREAMASQPGILFVAAAGNSDNDNTFAELVPSGFSLPNMITVGAIDSAGKPTGFTTFGKNVTLYANGFEVDSYIPGGTRMKFSGTSMAAPQVTNLAGKLFALRPELTVGEAIDLIRRGADPLPGHEGRLIINQKKTIELLKK